MQYGELDFTLDEAIRRYAATFVATGECVVDLDDYDAVASFCVYGPADRWRVVSGKWLTRSLQTRQGLADAIEHMRRKIDRRQYDPSYKPPSRES